MVEALQQGERKGERLGMRCLFLKRQTGRLKDGQTSDMDTEPLLPLLTMALHAVPDLAGRLAAGIRNVGLQALQVIAAVCVGVCVCNI